MAEHQLSEEPFNSLGLSALGPGEAWPAQLLSKVPFICCSVCPHRAVCQCVVSEPGRSPTGYPHGSRLLALPAASLYPFSFLVLSQSDHFSLASSS